MLTWQTKISYIFDVYHSCWWSGDTRSQGIHRNDIDLLSLPWMFRVIVTHKIVLQCWYHGCWCPGHARSHCIHGHDTEVLSLPWMFRPPMITVNICNITSYAFLTPFATRHYVHGQCLITIITAIHSSHKYLDATNLNTWLIPMGDHYIVLPQRGSCMLGGFTAWASFKPIHAGSFNKLRPRQNVCYFPDDIFKCLFLNEKVWLSIKISLKFVPWGPINNIPALVHMMAWRRPGDKSLSEPMMVTLMTHICGTRPQLVNHCPLNGI